MIFNRTDSDLIILKTLENVLCYFYSVMRIEWLAYKLGKAYWEWKNTGRLPSGLSLRLQKRKGRIVMNTAEIYAKVKGVLASELDVSADLIDVDTSVRADLGADDTDLVEILMDLEEAFDVDITDSDFEELETVGEVVEFIRTEME
ncbi:MAG: acyl carrier protein [Candidatus Onthomonas sp.]